RHVRELARAAAEGEARTLAVDVEAAREVDRERQPLRQAAALRREPHRPREALDRQLDARERADVARPDAGAADDAIGGDAARRRLHGSDATVTHVDPRRRAALADVGARFARIPLHDRLGRRVAVALAER